ncbi:hypothetical protein OFB80_29340, partial [Escherichia coli]|nr:hypothetical protein [Escherichia coli]
LALIKPDAVAHPLILEAVHQQILSNKFLIVRIRELLWKTEDCRRFYREHEGRFFYQRLVEFMTRLCGFRQQRDRSLLPGLQ